MATAAYLASIGELVAYEPRLKPRQMTTRSLFMTPAAYTYFRDVMPPLVCDRAQLVTPFAAANRCFTAFCCNEPFARVTAEYAGFRCFEGTNGVCELKTFDTRAIGFFWRKGIFIVTRILMRNELSTAKSYLPYIDEAQQVMSSLDLDPPKSIKDTRYDALF